MTDRSRPGRVGRRGLVVAAAVVVAVAVAVMAVVLALPTGSTSMSSHPCTARSPGQLTAAPASKAATSTTTAPPFRDNDTGGGRAPDTYADGDDDNKVANPGCPA